MGQIERLIQNYDTRVSLPWEKNLAGPQRVWFAVYNKAEERRLRRRFEEFEISTGRAKHGWIRVDLTDSFARWLAACDPDHRAGYFAVPEHLEFESPPLDDFKEALVKQVADVLTSPCADESAVVAVSGVASLFGFMKTSELVSKIEPLVRGRLLVFFPGEHENNTYRFLDARDGWNYLAVPITSDEGVKA
jgi:Domain of unknown function (DUF1788)